MLKHSNFFTLSKSGWPKLQAYCSLVHYRALELIIHYFDQEENVKGDDEDSDADLCLDENVAYGDRSNGHPGVATVIFIVAYI